MSYIKTNKEAWEEAFELRSAGWGDEVPQTINDTRFAYLDNNFVDIISEYQLEGSSIAQFCCNNGRELLSIVKSTSAKKGVGFDIAENIINQARENCSKIGLPCEFVICNALDIPEKYHDQFDYVILTIGALCWFKDLKELFMQIALCLKKEGVLIIQDTHPCTNMLAVEGEEVFDRDNLTKIAWSYFKQEPFIDNFGIGYITGKAYKSKTFTSFVHTMGDILNSIISCNIKLTYFKEYDYDIGLGVDELSGKGFPLSYILTAKKE